jgi:hypothetical protein
MIYRFRDGFHLNGDPQVVGETLEDIRRKHDGRLRPEAVVKAAREPNSALHGYFEWNDAKAARKYRLQQADYLIRAVVVCPEESDRPFEPVRAFVCIEESPGSRVFTHVCEAMRSETLREQVLRRARAELADWRRRYARLAEFAALFEAIDALVPTGAGT